MHGARGINATWSGLQELFEDCPEQFEKLAALVSRAGRPAFGALHIQFERGKVVLIREEVVHK